jgi:hypothetical protein
VTKVFGVQTESCLGIVKSKKFELFGLEVITQRPIAKHFEKSSVARVPYFFDILRTETFLRVGDL